MNGDTATLLAIRARLASVIEQLDRATSDPTVSVPADDREILAVTAMIVGDYRPRTKADVLRFVRAVKAGDDAWLVLRSLPGEQRVDASYFAHLPREYRALFER